MTTSVTNCIRQTFAIACVRGMALELGWIRFPNHDIKLDRLSAFGAIKIELRDGGRGLETSTLIVLKVIFVTAFKIAL